MLATSTLSNTQIHFFDSANSLLLISIGNGLCRNVPVSAPVPASNDDFALLEELKAICVNQGLISANDEIAMLAS
ncbi:hypothetical protein [Rheinheimera hassiensis]|uniref:hypothetical protein n=1 Tax=Rheinheimera hassiensis TaxID=1193627 RepID=UPI001F059EAF|nr:hypothetical protein [Rheinheimera hassiensis]